MLVEKVKKRIKIKLKSQNFDSTFVPLGSIIGNVLYSIFVVIQHLNNWLRAVIVMTMHVVWVLCGIALYCGSIINFIGFIFNAFKNYIYHTHQDRLALNQSTPISVEYQDATKSCWVLKKMHKVIIFQE